MNKLRIIAGHWRSRVITFPKRSELRPTPDRVRETLFNWLGQDLSGKKCLDLFAGSGALGFEALSRGAARVVMVERDPVVFSSLDQNKRNLSAIGLELVKDDALKFIRRTKTKYDLIFLDPPYRGNDLIHVLALIPAHLAPDGVVYVESPRMIDFEKPWKVLKKDKAGQVHYHLVQWKNHD